MQLDDKTRGRIAIILAITFAIIMLSFTAACVKIMWLDGNTPLVQTVTSNFSGALLYVIGGLAAIFLGKDIASAILTAKTTPTTVTTTTVPVPVQTPGTTVSVTTSPTAPLSD